MRDYHTILGVPPGATVAEIRKAYRRLAAKHHPDRNRGDKRAEERFKEIAAAYEALVNPRQGGREHAARRPAPVFRREPAPAPRRRGGPTFETGPIEMGKVYPVRPGPKLGKVPVNAVPVRCARVPVVSGGGFI